MNSNIDRDTYISLLNLLENNVITKEQFFKLLDVNGHDLKLIIESFNFSDLTLKEDFVDKAISCISFNTVFRILKKYSKYRSNIELRNFLFDNAQKSCLYDIAEVLQYDVLFEDKDFVEKLLKKVDSKDYKYGELRYISSFYKDNFSKVEQDIEDLTDKMKFLKLSLNVSDLRCVEDFFSVYSLEGFKNNIVFLECLIDYYNKSGSINKFSFWNDIYYCFEDNYEYVAVINDKIVKVICDSLMKMEEKEELINRFISNLINGYPNFELENKKYFDYFIRHIDVNEDDIYFHANNVSFFIDEDSSFIENSDMYKLLLTLDEDIRYFILDAYSNEAFSSYITEELLMKIKDERLGYADVKKLFKEVAQKNGCYDYLKETVSDSRVFFDDVFVKFMSSERKFSKEELLNMKERIENGKVVIDNDRLVLDGFIDEVQIPVVDQDSDTVTIEQGGFVKRLKSFFNIK